LWVFFEDENFTELDFEQRVPIRTQIGMLFQNSALFDSMTVEENIMFPLNLFTNQSLSEKRDRANFCLERVNLKDKNKLYPAELSGGMKKRVGIARAISMQPKYLFVDEPNSGLDPKTSILIDELINELTAEYEMTTVIVTHDMNSVMGIGDHIIFLHQGQKWWEGSNKEIAHTDNKELNDFVFASKFMQAAKDKI
jgi:phospholipid/cholesterol/gamma-HCH transport system ATP-binding protein